MSGSYSSIRSVLGEPYYSRFWAKVEKTETCWLWHGSIGYFGYGTFWLGRHCGKKAGVYAHIFSYQMSIGKIPDGLQLDHLCRVRHCVNPDHLEPVTRKENILRGMSPMARQARQTHCIYGHSLADAWVSSTGHRLCRACNRRKSRALYARRRDAARGTL
jgi:hypothetical protein